MISGLRDMGKSTMLLFVLLVSFLARASDATKYKMIESDEEYGLECAMCHKILTEKFLTGWNIQGHVFYC